MKIPKIFTPERNLDKKVEELNKTLQEKVLTIEEFKRKDMKVLYCNIYKEATSQRYLDEMKMEIEDKAVKKILEDTYKSLVKWKQDSEDPERYTAHATVLNANKEEITIPILFHTDNKFYHGTRRGYLQLGDEDGPCRNTYVLEIRQLVSDYFGIDLTKEKVETVSFK